MKKLAYLTIVRAAAVWGAIMGLCYILGQIR
jgi:hypothetical protein